MKQPKNLEECIAIFLKQTPKKDLDSWKTKDEETAVASLHFPCGMSLRNGWGLWGKNDLTKFFNKLGIYHADDMSGIIYTSLHRRLNDKYLDLPGQVKYYQDYWKNIGFKDGNPTNDSKENYTPNLSPIIIKISRRLNV